MSQSGGSDIQLVDVMPICKRLPSASVDQLISEQLTAFKQKLFTEWSF